MCLYVCLSQKSLFLYSKDLAVSPVSRHIPYSKNLVVSPVSRHFLYSRDLVISPVSRHFPYSKVSRNSKTTKSLEYGKCLKTGETTKSLEKSLFHGIWSFLLFLDTFRIQKCLETVKRQHLTDRPFSKNVTHAGHRPTF